MTMTRREKLFENGVQFGHQTRSWCPLMSRYIWGEKDGIHLINIEMTDLQITKAEKVLEEVAAKGLPILWVGTKRVARQSVMKYAQETSCPFFSERWIGGTLTNYAEVKKAVTNMLYNKEMLEKADRQMYTKKELGFLQKKIEKAEKSIGGIERLAQKPGLLVIVGVKEEGVALREAQKMGIPVVALVDTNCNPTGITVVVPGNDDRENSISLILGYFAEAIKRGREVYLKENPIALAEENAHKKTFGKRHAHQGQASRQHKTNDGVEAQSENSSEVKTTAASEKRSHNGPRKDGQAARNNKFKDGQSNASRKESVTKKESAELKETAKRPAKAVATKTESKAPVKAAAPKKVAPKKAVTENN